MTRDEFADAIDAVTALANAYRGGLTYDDALSAVHAPGTIKWTPVYSQLLTELEARLLIAGHRYDRLADTRLIDESERFDWRSYLRPPPD